MDYAILGVHYKKIEHRPDGTDVMIFDRDVATVRFFVTDDVVVDEDVALPFLIPGGTAETYEPALRPMLALRLEALRAEHA